MRAKTIAYIIIITVFQFVVLGDYLRADEIILKNQDRVSGTIIKQDPEVIIIDTEAMGEISINREFVETISIDAEETVTLKQAPPEPKLWQGEVSIGYNRTSGNTETAQSSISIYANRKTDDDEFTIKGDSFYSSSNKNMDAQKWSGMVRYAFSFLERKWYNFYKLETDHDRFANIDYRIIPSSGIGYWFSDQDDWRALAEAGLGLEHTNFRDETKDSDEPVFIVRGFLEKRLIGESRVLEDLFLYPSLSDTSQFRLHSETSFTNPISERLSLRFSLINDYDSDPPKNTKKHDIRLITSILYSF